MMGTVTESVFDSISEFADLIGANHTFVGEMQVCRLGRILDGEGERERNLSFYGTTVHQDCLETPLANGADCGIDEQRITRNGLHVGD
jgi:hypothetical protein